MSGHLVGVAEIARLLGVSRQRVSQILDAYPDFPQPEAELSAGRVWARSAVETWMAAHPDRRPGRKERGSKMRGLRGLLMRMSDDCKVVFEMARDEADRLLHSYIGTEHILLALAKSGETDAGDLLRRVLSADDVVSEIEERVGAGATPPTRRPSFTGRAKKVMELSLREALKVGDNMIRPEHLLLGLIADAEFMSAKILRALDVDLEWLRESAAKLAGGDGAAQAQEPEPSEDVLRDVLRQLDAITQRLDDIERRLSESS